MILRFGIPALHEKHVSKIAVGIRKIRVYLDCLIKVALCLLIATQLAESRPKIVERGGMIRVDLHQFLIKGYCLGISSFCDAFTALGKEAIDVGRLRSADRLDVRDLVRLRIGAIPGQVHDQSLCNSIGRFLVDTILEQPPFEGVGKACLLVEIKVKSSNFPVDTLQDVVQYLSVCLLWRVLAY